MSSPKMTNSNQDQNHIAWADYIKCFHARLQEEMRNSLVTEGNDERSTTNSSSAFVSSDNASPSSSSSDELAHWQAMMSSSNKERQQSLKHYANAMHRLATEYWSSQNTCKRSKENEECPSAHTESSTLESKTQCEQDECHEKESKEMKEKMNSDKKSDDDVSCQANRKSYNDRVKLCLWCMEDYFIGKINPVLLCNGITPTKSKTCYSEKQEMYNFLPTQRQSVKSEKEHLESTTSETVSGTIPLFAQLPRILTRQVKPIRQAFFREHHCVASAWQVEQMFSTLLQETLTSECKEKEEKQLTNKHVEYRQETLDCTQSKDNCNIKSYMKLTTNLECDCTLIALRYVVECVQHQWCALAHLHFLPEMYYSILKKESPSKQEESSFSEGKLSSHSAHRLPPLRVLDVGSCYGAFCGKSLSHALLGSVPLEVIAVDLEPVECMEFSCKEHQQQLEKEESRNEAVITSVEMKQSDRQYKRQRVEEQKEEIVNMSNNLDNKIEEEEEKIRKYDALTHKVWRCDWLSVKFFSETQEREHKVAVSNSYITVVNGLLRLCRRGANHATQSVNNNYYLNSQSVNDHYEVAEIPWASFDVVLFCLLLSFMPTPRLRFRACLHAYLALKRNGLLVIVCTRTQGSRHGQWVQQWVECIEHIGFTRVHQRMHKQLIILSFAKISSAYSNTISVDNDDTNSNDLDSSEKRERWIQTQMQSSVADHLRIIADDKL